MSSASLADGIVSGRRSLLPRVSDAALRGAKLHDASVTVGEISAFLEDDHVHMAVLLGTDGELLTTVERSDLTLASPPEPALRYGTLEGRTVGAHEELHRVWETMLAEGRRRLAVIDADGRLVGLLCLKRHGRGFCSDSDVRQRACSR
jgi:CBS domain-containing protein